jgi:hypothetical protein
VGARGRAPRAPQREEHARRARALPDREEPGAVRALRGALAPREHGALQHLLQRLHPPRRGRGADDGAARLDRDPSRPASPTSASSRTRSTRRALPRRRPTSASRSSS